MEVRTSVREAINGDDEMFAYSTASTSSPTPTRVSGTHRVSGWSAYLAGACLVDRLRPRQSGLLFRLEGRSPPPRTWPHLAQTLQLLAEGASNALIASRLGISEATASRRISQILTPGGQPRAVFPLVARVLAQMTAPGRACYRASVLIQGPSSWTAGEREVACLSLQGSSLQEIALRRESSLATVRAQLRQAARKAGCADRYELGASRKIDVFWNACRMDRQNHS